jgi:hypothetical protein
MCRAASACFVAFSSSVPAADVAVPPRRQRRLDQVALAFRQCRQAVERNLVGGCERRGILAMGLEQRPDVE